MTTAELMSGTGAEARPSAFSRVAAAGGVLLGAVLLEGLSDFLQAAFYVAILAVATAVVAFASAYLLWTRGTLIARATASFAAWAALVGEVLHLLLGLPGVTDLGRLTVVESGLGIAAAGLVLVFLLLDVLLRKPEPAPEQPYAL